MKRILYKPFLVLLCLCLLLSAAGCAKDDAAPAGEDGAEQTDLLNDGVPYTPLGVSHGLTLVAENDRYQLLLDEATSTIGVYVKASGYLWKSNLGEEEVAAISNEEIAYDYRSQVLISYYNSSNTEVLYNSYQYAVMENDEYNPTVKYFERENGLRIVYRIGQNVDDFYMPMVLTQEYYDRLFGQLSPEDAETLSFYYEPLVYDEVDPELIDRYKLQYKNFSPGDTIYQCATTSKVVKQQCYNDYLRGIVDLEFLEEAYDAAGYGYSLPDAPQFTVALDYTLTPEGLSVNVPMDVVEYNDNAFRLHSIEVLPYFGAVTAGSGEMFLPDGSGAMIDTEVKTMASIGLPFYGADRSLWTEEVAENMQQASLPVYGINTGKNAFVAYVSDGAAVGTVECHPKNDVYPYAYIGGSYIIHPFETFVSNGATASATMQRYASDPYTGNIALDYRFISGDSLTYVDMAKAVRNYLFSGHDRVADDTLRFYYDTYGMVLRKENFLGYAYNKKVALTTFEQAQGIYDRLNEAGITNIAVRYNNWYNDAYVNKLSNIGKVSGVIGGRGDMTDFMAYVTEKGGRVYPNVELIMEKYSTSLSNATWHSKFIDGTLINWYESDLWTDGVTADLNRIVVKSGEVVKRLPGITGKLQKLEVPGVALSTVANQLFTDFTEDRVKYRDGVEDDMVTVLQQLSEQMPVMVEGANAYALPYASEALDVSMGCSNLSFEKQEVPFLAIVLHGYVPFAGTSMNLADDYDLQLLKSVEFGANLSYTLNSAPAEMVKYTNYSELYSTNADHWLQKATEDYAAAAAVLNGCQGSTIEDHKMVAPDVYMTTYENGAQVLVNYSQTDYRYQGVTVPARGFARADAAAKEG